MGCRLYPITENKRILELIANVPVGTSNALETILSEFERKVGLIRDKFAIAQAANDEDGMNACSIERSKIDQDRYDAVNSNEHIARMNHFDNDGWGRVYAESVDLFKKYGYETSIGATTDPDQVRAILYAQEVALPAGITHHDLEGVAWS